MIANLSIRMTAQRTMAHRLTPTGPKSWDSMAMACGRKDDVAQMNRCDESMENWVNRIGIHLEKVCRGE